MTEEQRALLAEINDQIAASLIEREDEKAASWEGRLGILLSRAEIIALLRLIPVDIWNET